jgi:tRNA(Ile)-lysidine synthase TilS/MesJ
MENKTKQKIQELSLDQKAKLYFMGLVRKGVIDTLPEDPKAAYIRDMMDKEDPKMDPEIRSDFDDPTFENLKEAASKLGYLNEDDMLNKIEKGVTAITGGGRRHASVSDRGDSIRVMFRYMRGEFAPEEWDKILKYLTGMGFEIKDESNSYEPNYDREEPPEWVPTIHLKK